MATTTRVLTASVSGTVYTTNANDALEAIDTCHSGTSAPTDEVANGKFWLDTTTTPAILKIYNNATWTRVAQDTTAVAITGGTITGITDLTVADGGTGASTASVAFGNLKQAATLTSTGVVEQSTSAENVAGTSDTVFPSVLGTKEMIDTHASAASSIKAWVNFNGDGAVAIVDSFNVSSITDNGTGDYTLNLTTSLANANYVTIGSAYDTSTNSTRTVGPKSQTASSSTIKVVTASGGATDPEVVHVAIIN